jgi:hypothetical protein
MVAGVVAITLIAVGLQYWPRNRAIAPDSLNDSGLAVALDSNGVVQGLGDASGLERDQVSLVLKDRALPLGPVQAVTESAETEYRIRQLRASRHPSHLLMAVIFARESLYPQAESELQILARENPGSALVQSLEKSISVQNAGRK